MLNWLTTLFATQRQLIAGYQWNRHLRTRRRRRRESGLIQHGGMQLGAVKVKLEMLT